MVWKIKCDEMCQSCGIPLDNDVKMGTEADGSQSELYCSHCYQKGKFTQSNATAEQMQSYCVDVLTKQQQWPGLIARLYAKAIPDLERWQHS